MGTHVRMDEKLKVIVDKHVENLKKIKYMNITLFVDNAVRSALKKDGVDMT